MLTNENKTAIQAATSKYVFVEDMVNAISAGIQTGKNVLLYGPGGHAKSAVAESVLRVITNSLYVKSFGVGSSLDDVLGHLDVNGLLHKEGGPRVYNHDNSFMNSEYAIFEELFDAPAPVLETLKDVLTRKAYCVGGEVCYASKCKVIIGCTNHDPHEWAKNGRTDSEKNSRRALVERFPIMVNVRWPNYGSMEYMSMFNAIFGKEMAAAKMNLVADIAAKSTRNNFFVSPRTSRHLLETYVNTGDIKSLKFMQVDPRVVDFYIDSEKQIEQDLKILEKLDPINVKLEEIKKLLEKNSDVLTFLQFGKILDMIQDKLSNLVAGEHAIQHLGKTRTLLRVCQDLARKGVDKYLSVKQELIKQFVD